MSADLSPFRFTSGAFGLAPKLVVREHLVAFEPAEHLIQSTSRIFRGLDRSIPEQVNISRSLWVLRSLVVNTLVPLDSESLGLSRRTDELGRALRSTSIGAHIIEELLESVENAVQHRGNPKLDRLKSVLAQDGDSRTTPTGILVALSFGKSPGFGDDAMEFVGGELDGVRFIRSRADLRQTLLNRIVLPCGCRNAPSQLLSEVVFGGRAAVVDVLLYSAERFQVPPCPRLPKSNTFRNPETSLPAGGTSIVAASGDTGVSPETWADRQMREEMIRGDGSGTGNAVSARYVLFADGTGAFFPEDGMVLVVPDRSGTRADSDITYVPLGDLREGDHVAFRVGASGSLLDDFANKLAVDENLEDLEDKATGWKDALEGVLLHLTNEQVAERISRPGHVIGGSSVDQWASGKLLGPGDAKVFLELIRLLHSEGKLDVGAGGPAEYAQVTWKRLEALRNIKKRAGFQLRAALLRELGSIARMDLPDRTSVRMVGDTNAEMVILRVATIDDRGSSVSPARLHRLEEHGSAKWLG